MSTFGNFSLAQRGLANQAPSLAGFNMRIGTGGTAGAGGGANPFAGLLNTLGNNAEGIGSAIGGLSNLAGTIYGINAARDAQGLANMQFNALQEQQQRELARQGLAQAAFDEGFAQSGLAGFTPGRRRVDDQGRVINVPEDQRTL